MIICQTPLRVSFFGGGTDFPEFFSAHGGAVLATAIDKYIYHSVSHFPSKLFDYSIRLAYRKVECVNDLAEIEHVPFREILRYLGIERDVEISLTADLPSFSGLGSSSSFTVGSINALNAFQGRFIPKGELANLAIRMEREILREAVGLQDQIIAAYGGLNVIEFSAGDNFVVHRVAISKAKLQELDASLLLFFTGVTRRASEIEKRKIENLHRIEGNLKRMLTLVEKAHGVLTGNGSLAAFGELLGETWREKRALDLVVSSPAIDKLYELAGRAGALGGKLLGAGGGGFMLLFVPEERQAKVREALKDYIEIGFSINSPGSSIIHS
jgi:D-glycero-alpha-D-manno-heptose-7-phosphate kinase